MFWMVDHDVASLDLLHTGYFNGFSVATLLHQFSLFLLVVIIVSHFVFFSSLLSFFAFSFYILVFHFG